MKLIKFILNAPTTHCVLFAVLVFQCILLQHHESMAMGKRRPPLPNPKAAKTAAIAARRNHKPNPTTTRTSFLPNMSPKEAAISMNSIEFLKELVRKKDTFNEHYYYASPQKMRLPTNEHNNGLYQSNNTSLADVVVVEYTGRLWFMKKKNQDKKDEEGGIRFQESVRIQNVSKCGTTSTVECITKYKKKNGTHTKRKGVGEDNDNDDGQWIDCSKVVCTFTSPNYDSHNSSMNNSSSSSGSSSNGSSISSGSSRSSSRIISIAEETNKLHMKIGSEVLLQIPLLGVGGAVRKQISDTFEVAAKAYFRQKMLDL